MNIIDLVIIIFLLYSIFMGYTRGVIQEAFKLVGNFLVIIFSFFFTKSLSDILCNSLPLYNFEFFDIHLSCFWIFIYHIIAFVMIALALKMLVNFILMFTGIVDTVVDLIPIFNRLSRILGMVLGFFGGLIVSFIVLLVISVPLASSTLLHESKYANYILDNTFIVSGMAKNIRGATNDVYNLSMEIKKDEERLDNTDGYNAEMLNIMLKYDLVSLDTIDKLVEQEKIDNTKAIERTIKRYKDKKEKEENKGE